MIWCWTKYMLELYRNDLPMNNVHTYCAFVHSIPYLVSSRKSNVNWLHVIWLYGLILKICMDTFSREFQWFPDSISLDPLLELNLLTHHYAIKGTLLLTVIYTYTTKNMFCTHSLHILISNVHVSTVKLK